MSFIVLGASLFTLFFLWTAVDAESNWWQQGKSLLDNLVQSKNQDELTIGEIEGGLRDALHVGVANVAGRLGQVDGFNADSIAHIYLPENFATVKSVLARVGMSHLLDDLELKLNRAAEAAIPKAKELFWQAITEMTVDDVIAVYNGPNDAATKYFQGKMSPALKDEMRPVVEDKLSEVGAIQSYDRVMGQYRSLPFIPDVKADLTGHVLDKGVDGIFYYLAKEEAAIRKDPLKQTTSLLKRVFGTRK